MPRRLRKAGRNRERPITTADIITGTELARIRAVKSAYFASLDGKDWDALAALLAPDCAYVVHRRPHDPDPKRRSGRDAIVASIRRTVGGAVTVHRWTEVAIAVLGDDRATGIWDMTDRTAIGAGGDRRVLAGSGRYEEIYARANGRWCIARLELFRHHLTEIAGDADR